MPSPDLSTPAPLPSSAAAPAASTSGNAALWRGLDHAHMMQVELIAAVALWGWLGLLADRALGTTPIGVIVGALVGYGAGLYLVWLRTQRMDAQEAADAGSAGTAAADAAVAPTGAVDGA